MDTVSLGKYKQQWSRLERKSESIENLLITLSTGSIVLIFNSIFKLPVSIIRKDLIIWGLFCFILSIICCLISKILDYYLLDRDPLYAEKDKKERSYKVWKNLANGLEFLFWIEMVFFINGIISTTIFSIFNI